MRKWLRFEDGDVVELSPISYREFMAIDQWQGASDMAFDAWKRLNGYVEAEDFNEEALQGCKFFVSLEPIDAARFKFLANGSDEKPTPYDPDRQTGFGSNILWLKPSYGLGGTSD